MNTFESAHMCTGIAITGNAPSSKSSFMFLPPSLSPSPPQSETCLLNKVPLSNVERKEQQIILNHSLLK